ncbi:hypothetical protein [Maribellus sediminis]|uniref:hypothetical protein n=1 Tax=Maribellus sediminis TaxID=2696285 RepID=UPI00142FCF1C|nr:hypothetical protein [Maribellus sediminis]
MKKIYTYLIATAALMIISAAAMAQGGQNPLVGSTHYYKVVPGKSGNTFQWSVTGGVAGTDYTINSASTTTDSLNITWLTKVGNPHKIIFQETDATTNCITTKELTLNVVDNTFDVSIASPDDECNSATDTTDANNNFTTTDFSVSMVSGSTTWNPNWEITFNVASGNIASTIDDVSSTSGTLTDNGGGSFTLTGITSASGEGAATISVRVAGSAFDELSAVVEITEAKELDYNTPDKDTNDWTATGIINPIPNTSSIITD